MLSKLRDLVFGLNGFEKTKIDIRFLQIGEILNDIKINSIYDFEILEEVIFKIKELLRVKSSNLNKSIKDPKNKLTKKKVLQILDKLNEIKYNFLDLAFKAIENNVKENLSSKDINEDSKNKNNFSLEFENFVINLIFNETIVLKVEFKNNFDLVLLKNLSTIFFDIFNSDGTNIVINNDFKTAYIISRKLDDNLFRLEVNGFERENLENTFKKLNLHKENDFLVVEEKEDLEKLEKYIEPKDDKIIKNQKESKEFISIKDEKEEKSNIVIEKEPVDIVIEKKPEIELEGIELLKNEENNVKINKNTIKNTDSKNIVRNKIEIETINTNTNCNSNKNNVELQNYNQGIEEKYLIYKDNEIKVYFEFSKDLTKLVISFIDDENFNKVELNKMNYLLLFSKIFSSVLFDVLNCAGTNIIFSYNNNKLYILPRFQNDSINFNLNRMELNNETLEKIKNEYISVLAFKAKKITDNLKKNSSNLNVNKEDISQKINNNVKTEKKEKENKENLKEKAKILLDTLRRIP
jgi:hypothetical protein